MIHLSQASPRAAIARALDWSLDGCEQVLSCIVMTNRMLSGGRIGGHPVRGAHELASFIKSGTINVFVPAQGTEQGAEIVGHYWEGDSLGQADLCAYLREDVMHRDVFECMRRQDFTHRVGTVTVREGSYVLRSDLLVDRIRSRRRA